MKHEGRCNAILLYGDDVNDAMAKTLLCAAARVGVPEAFSSGWLIELRDFNSTEGYRCNDGIGPGIVLLIEQAVK